MASIFSIDPLRIKFDALNAREQLLLVLVVGVGIYSFFESTVLLPQHGRGVSLQAAHALAQTQAIALRTEISAVGHSDGVLRQAQADNALLKQKTAMLSAVLGSIHGNAPQVGDLVRSVLKDDPHVSLDFIKTLPVKTLMAATPSKRDRTAPATSPDITIYKHGLELEIHGNYLDLLAYLNRLEASTHHVFWSDVTVRTDSYPRTSLRMTIFILSEQAVLKIS